jgi:hypothetical protein
MLKRIIDVSRKPARLTVLHNHLRIKRADQSMLSSHGIFILRPLSP